jgi:hypothetical protein
MRAVVAISNTSSDDSSDKSPESGSEITRNPINNVPETVTEENDSPSTQQQPRSPSSKPAMGGETIECFGVAAIIGGLILIGVLIVLIIRPRPY